MIAASRTKWRFTGFGRFWLAGPVALIAAYLLMAAMPIWLPRGSGGIDHLAFPLLLFPAFWAVLFFYAVLTENIKRAAWVLATLVVVNAGVAGWSVLGG